MHAVRDTACRQVFPSSSPVILSPHSTTKTTTTRTTITATIKAALTEKLPQKYHTSPPRRISPDYEAAGTVLSTQRLLIHPRYRIQSLPTRNKQKNRSKGQSYHSSVLTVETLTFKRSMMAPDLLVL